MGSAAVPPDLEYTNCPLCGCPESHAVIHAGDNLCAIPGMYAVHRCVGCRHLFMNPRPTPETLSRCYPDNYAPHLGAVSVPDDSSQTPPWYLRYLPLRYIPGLRAFYYWLVTDVDQQIPPQPVHNPPGSAPRAIELGCSTGRYLAKLAAEGWEVVGVEPSESASDKARQAGLCVHTGLLDDVSLPEAHFDCAMAWMVIEHVIDPAHTLRQFYRLLKPGGRIMINVPNAGCWEPKVFRSNWYAWDLPRHLHHFTPKTIRRLMETVGFVDVEVLHQKNISYIIGSLGVLLSRFSVTKRIGERMFQYPDSPRLPIQLALSPLAHMLSWLHQGGRLTIMAKRPMSVPERD